MITVLLQYIAWYFECLACFQAGFNCLEVINGASAAVGIAARVSPHYQQKGKLCATECIMQNLTHGIKTM